MRWYCFHDWHSFVFMVPYLVFFGGGAQQPPSGPGSPRSRGSYITLRHTTLGRTFLDGWWSSRRRDLYLTTYNTHNRQTSMSSEGFEPAIPANERPQTYALDSAAAGTGIIGYRINYIQKYLLLSVEVNCWLQVSTKGRPFSGQYVTQK